MSKTTKDPILSKERILHAAEEIFAHRGFDAARVDDIALKAGVNKALIYYYFESKEEILHALIHHTIAHLLTQFGSFNSLLEKSLSSKESMRALFVSFLKFIEEHRDLFTIILMELIKDSKNKSLILSHLIKEIQAPFQSLKAFNQAEDEKQLLTTELFTGFLPIMMFALLEDPLQQLWKVKRDQLQEMFIQAMELTHIRYSFEMFKKEGRPEKGKAKE